MILGFKGLGRLIEGLGLRDFYGIWDFGLTAFMGAERILRLGFRAWNSWGL